MILLVPYYQPREPIRRMEIDLCLRRNLCNPAINKVVAVIDSMSTTVPPGALVRYVKGLGHTFRNLVHVANRDFLHERVLLANADILFDDSLRLLTDCNLNGRAIALTRHEQGPDGTLRLVHQEGWSQDAWLFKTPLSILGNYPFGALGCDNRFAYELLKAGLRLSNPAYTVRAIHVHSEPAKHVHGTVPEPHAYVYLTISPDEDSTVVPVLEPPRIAQPRLEKREEEPRRYEPQAPMDWIETMQRKLNK